jgi:hypothetical protein
MSSCSGQTLRGEDGVSHGGAKKGAGRKGEIIGSTQAKKSVGDEGDAQRWSAGDVIEVLIGEGDEWQLATVTDIDDPEGLGVKFDDDDDEYSISWHQVGILGDQLVRHLPHVEESFEVPGPPILLGSHSGDGRKSARCMAKVDLDEATQGIALLSDLVASVRDAFEPQRSGRSMNKTAAHYDVPYSTLTR